MNDIELPNLSDSDIDKLDDLFNFLKTELTVNKKHGFFPIDAYCEQKWGDNFTLYECFAKTLANNNLTDTQIDKGKRYIWGQKCSQNGIAFDSFRREYIRQGKIKKQEQTDKAWNRFLKIADVISKPILIVSLILSIAWNFLQLYNSQTNETDRKQLQTTIDSLMQATSNPQIINTYSNDTDTIQQQK